MNKLGSDYKSQKEFAICLAIAISMCIISIISHNIFGI
jgi:hypothetical protein